MSERFAGTYFITLAGDRLPSDLARRILSVTITDEDGKLGKAEIEFNNQDLAITDDDRLAKGKAISIRFGYLDDPSHMAVWNGVVRGVRGFLTRTLVAYETGQELGKQARSQVYAKARYSDVATQIANRYGLKPVVQPTKAVHEQVSQVNETDGHLLQRLAQEVGFEFWVGNGELHFHPPSYGDKPVALLTWTRPGEVVGDLISFEPEEKDLGEPSEVAVTGFDPLEKQIIQAQGSNEKTQRTTLGIFTPLVDAAKSVVGSTARTEEEAKDLADGMFNLAESSVETARATTIGNPKLRARKLVTLDGVGKHYGGNWRIKRAVHKLAGSYLTELELERNATGTPAGAKPTGGQPNTTKAQAPKPGEKEREPMVDFSLTTGKELGIRK